MKVFQISLMKAMVNLLAPSSPAFGNATNPFSAQEGDKQYNIDLQLQPGDIIFTQTNTFIYNSSRNFLGIKYDHVAVVINKQQILHISPPITSRLLIKSLFNKTRSPLVIRPGLQSQQKQRFIKKLTDLLGTKYSMTSIPQIFFNQTLSKLNISQRSQFSFQKLKQSRICSDAIMYVLCDSCSTFKKQIQTEISQTNYSKLGFMLPDDFLNSLKKNHKIIYQSSSIVNEKINDKTFLQTASLHLQQIYQNTKKHAGDLLILANFMTFLKPNTDISKQTLFLKNYLIDNLKIVSLSILLCDFMGVKVGSADYTNKIMMLTSLMTVLGSSLLVKSPKNTQIKYSLPQPNQIQKLHLATKPKI